MIRLSREYIRDGESRWDYICRLISESSAKNNSEEDE